VLFFSPQLGAHREVLHMGTRYLCATWQGLLQELVYLVGVGYHYYHVTYLPERKKQKWYDIDHKLITKYKADKNKFERARQKRKGIANFFYVRWENVAVILHTEGELEDGVIIDDQFHDICQRPLRIRVSDLVSFDIVKFGDRYTVKLSKDTYKGLKAELVEVVKTKNRYKIIHAYDRVNGFPAWAGIINQKRLLAEFVCRQADKHGVRLFVKDLRIVDRRKPVKVWLDESDEESGT
jgi:hypothetical protein